MLLEMETNKDNSVNPLAVPQDLIRDILSRLPIKTILRFKRVLKPWAQLIESPTFARTCSLNSVSKIVVYMELEIKSKGVTMTALLAKATTLAVVQHTVVNSSCRDGKTFTYNSHINVAVAVAVDGGLITPVLQDADKMPLDIYSLLRKWKKLVDKARAKQLQPQEYNSGTFIRSNFGMFGVDRCHIATRNGAIMAVGAFEPTLVGTKDGQMQ
ncbi:hypothetical protein OROMI_025458 [Orobanche minor]